MGSIRLRRMPGAVIFEAEMEWSRVPGGRGISGNEMMRFYCRIVCPKKPLPGGCQNCITVSAIFNQSVVKNFPARSG